MVVLDNACQDFVGLIQTEARAGRIPRRVRRLQSEEFVQGGTIADHHVNAVPANPARNPNCDRRSTVKSFATGIAVRAPDLLHLDQLLHGQLLRIERSLDE
jgi:hypothetical protein